MVGVPTCPNLSNHANQPIIGRLIDYAMTKFVPKPKKGGFKRAKLSENRTKMRGSHEYVGSIERELIAYGA